MRNDLLTVMACVTPFTITIAQSQLIGRVLDEQEQGAPFVLVHLGDTDLSTQTDEDGAFRFTSVPRGAQRVHFERIGYTPLDTLLVMGEGEVVIRLRPVDHVLRGVEVNALRAGDRSPFAQNRVTRTQLDRMNTGVDMPLLLDPLPSVVTTTDAGTGFGYTGIRIRGSDATRINVTVNGVPINGAEDQTVYWVDMSDLASSTEDIEVQRGVGSSTNGPGAFGASVNVRTTEVNKEANASVSAFGGSYGTQRYMARFGTGLINKAFSFDGRISSIRSDGYIDRATADLKSYFLQGAWIGRTNSVRFITFSGTEVTYQAWDGVPLDTLPVHRTYNAFTYDNQVDDYTQTHYQLLFDQAVGANADLNITLFRVNGAGYYEQFRSEDELADYGLTPPVLGSDTVSTSDIIRRKWLDNSLTGVNLALNVRHGAHRFTFGGNFSDYAGDHFGEVIWARFAGNSDIRHRYYDDDAHKADANVFAKLTYALRPSVDLFAEAQVRMVNYTFQGLDGDQRTAEQEVDYTFFNPKAGLQWRIDGAQVVRASATIGNREPNRDDLVETTPQSRPSSEHLLDVELGYTRRNGRSMIAANLYHMEYTDQLVLTGELNDVGSALRTNVPSSYRQGIEIEANVRIGDRLLIGGNFTLSSNIIRNYTEYVDDWDNGGQVAIEHGDAEIAFSPSAIANGNVGFRFWRSASKGHADITWIIKYVGQQFLDNSGSDERALDAYVVNDLRLNVSLPAIKGVRSMEFIVTARNIFSELYESNGWVYSYYTAGAREAMIGLYPQAPASFMAGVTASF